MFAIPGIFGQRISGVQDLAFADNDGQGDAPKSVYTFNGVNLGQPERGRHLYMLASGRGAVTRDYITATLGGVSGVPLGDTLVADGGPSRLTHRVFSFDLDTGTTAQLIITLDGDMTHTQFMLVRCLHEKGIATVYRQAGVDNQDTITLANAQPPNNGELFYFGSCGVDDGGTVQTTWTNALEQNSFFQNSSRADWATFSGSPGDTVTLATDREVSIIGEVKLGV